MANDERYKKGRYKTEIHYFPGSTDSERQSFRDGVDSVRSRPYLHAYYAGVGYAKGVDKKSVGFKNDEEKERFDAGMKEADRHYMVVEHVKRPREPTMLSRFFKKLFAKAKARKMRKADMVASNKKPKKKKSPKKKTHVIRKRSGKRKPLKQKHIKRKK